MGEGGLGKVYLSPYPQYELQHTAGAGVKRRRSQAPATALSPAAGPLQVAFCQSSRHSDGEGSRMHCASVERVVCRM